MMVVLHTGTTDNWFDCRRLFSECEKRPASDESAFEVARSEPSHPKFKALESGYGLGEAVTKGIQSIQGRSGREAF